MLDAATVGALIAIATAVGSGATYVIKSYVDAKIKLRADKLASDQYEDTRADKGYEFVIASQNARITTNELALEAVRKLHMDCEKIQAGLQVQNVAQQGQLDHQLRQLKVAEEQIARLQKQVEELEHPPPKG